VTWKISPKFRQFASVVRPNAFITMALYYINILYYNYFILHHYITSIVLYFLLPFLSFSLSLMEIPARVSIETRKASESIKNWINGLEQKHKLKVTMSRQLQRRQYQHLPTASAAAKSPPAHSQPSPRRSPTKGGAFDEGGDTHARPQDRPAWLLLLPLLWLWWCCCLFWRARSPRALPGP
jgi:hypothetical protein